jgi:hypothetical protein
MFQKLQQRSGGFVSLLGTMVIIIFSRFASSLLLIGNIVICGFLIFTPGLLFK